MKFLLVLAIALTGCSAIQKKEDGPRVTPPHLIGWSYECHQLESVEGAHYCIHTKGVPVQTVWYFHGLGCTQDILQDGQTCIPKKEGVSEKALMTALNDTTIITVSFGQAWMMDPISPKTQADKDATTKNFSQKIMPEIEGKHKLPKPWKAVGHSMGGHNAITLAMSYPLMFSKVILLHPMLITCDPWALGVGLKCVGGIFFIGAEFPREKWAKVNPLERVKNALLPETWVTVCWKDEFNLVDGPKKFAMTGMTGGLPVYLLEKTAGCSHYEYDAQWVARTLN